MENGQKVKFNYKLSIDGNEIEVSQEPLQFEVGAQQIIPGLEKEVITMKPGEKKKIDVEAKDAYGVKKDELIQQVPVSVFGENKVEVGGQVVLKHKDTDHQFQGIITSIEGEVATIDLNHPLADKDLTFEVEIVSVE